MARQGTRSRHPPPRAAVAPPTRHLAGPPRGGLRFWRRGMAAGKKDIEQGRAIEQTLGAWQPRTSKALSAEDAREMARNVSGFFSVLRRWEAAERIIAHSPAESTAR